MFTIIITDKEKTFFIGDIHGKFDSIGEWVENNDLSNCNIIFCGDFGLGFSDVEKEKFELKKSNEICEKLNVDCYVLRGNHDDPSYYNNTDNNFKLSNIQTLQDYTVIETPRNKILCIGGAISVDRINRISNYRYEVDRLVKYKGYAIEEAQKKIKQYWWEDEPFIYNEDVINELKKANINIDAVATHTAPSFCQPLTNAKAIGWSRIDSDLEKDLYDERLNVTKLYNKLKSNGNNLMYWFYGHYHTHNYEIIEGTKFIGLDMGRDVRNYGHILDMADIK